MSDEARDVDQTSPTPPTPIKCCTSEELKLFAGAAILVAVCMIAGYFIPEYRTVAGVQFGALVGAAAMRMRGS